MTDELKSIHERLNDVEEQLASLVEMLAQMGFLEIEDVTDEVKH